MDGVPEATPSSAPQIRGEMPPPSKVAEIQNFKEECRRFDTYEYVLIGTLATLGLVLAFWSASATFLIFIAAGFIWQQFNKKRKDLEQKEIIVNEPIILDPHDIEFTTPLSDNTLLCTTVHFLTPRKFEHNNQLFLITENLLVNFSQQFKDPPTKEAIEDYLRTKLVQFQDETNLPVLRLNIPISLRIPPTPEKPRNLRA
jgi:hypothetical protein